ncbi:hypothetical protein DAEQUDRAFT_741211 [Daedalea quercina L-15889]|uniref:Uncharacterized protein n=1 Tax=Daedalea quercina L-15889 TaxID=1314783 RepID=A0A165LKR5_9APHY|nr:hypothetical protein DAEQUDRAFT_741211 [Daedalea quercina L-15889]
MQEEVQEGVQEGSSESPADTGPITWLLCWLEENKNDHHKLLGDWEKQAKVEKQCVSVAKTKFSDILQPAAAYIFSSPEESKGRCAMYLSSLDDSSMKTQYCNAKKLLSSTGQGLTENDCTMGYVTLKVRLLALSQAEPYNDCAVIGAFPRLPNSSTNTFKQQAARLMGRWQVSKRPSKQISRWANKQANSQFLFTTSSFFYDQQAGLQQLLFTYDQQAGQQQQFMYNKQQQQNSTFNINLWTMFSGMSDDRAPANEQMEGWMSIEGMAASFTLMPSMSTNLSKRAHTKSSSQLQDKRQQVRSVQMLQSGLASEQKHINAMYEQRGLMQAMYYQTTSNVALPPLPAIGGMLPVIGNISLPMMSGIAPRMISGIVPSAVGGIVPGAIGAVPPPMIGISPMAIGVPPPSVGSVPTPHQQCSPTPCWQCPSSPHRQQHHAPHSTHEELSRTAEACGVSEDVLTHVLSALAARATPTASVSQSIASSSSGADVAGLATGGRSTTADDVEEMYYTVKDT